MANSYELMEIARIGVLYLNGDLIEEAMTPERRAYTSTDDIDFEEVSYNALKRTLLLTERIDTTRNIIAVLWVRRPDQPHKGEVLVAGKSLPEEGYDVVELNPAMNRALSGLPTRRVRKNGETVYYPVRDSDEDIVGMLEVSELRATFFI
jgi:hypothetical protein